MSTIDQQPGDTGSRRSAPALGLDQAETGATPGEVATIIGEILGIGEMATDENFFEMGEFYPRADTDIEDRTALDGEAVDDQRDSARYARDAGRSDRKERARPRRVPARQRAARPGLVR